MLLPLFSSSESLCMDPVTIAIILVAIPAAVKVAVPLINNTGSAINNICSSYYPTAIDTAIAEAAKVEAAKSRKELNYLDEETKFRDCLKNSKPDSDRTAHGVPTACEQLMHVFMLCGGDSENEITAMTKLFNKSRN